MARRLEWDSILTAPAGRGLAPSPGFLSPACLAPARGSNVYEVVGLGQVSRSVADIGRAEAWYRDVLGLRHLYTFDKLAFFDCGGTRVMLSQQEALEPAESILYLRVQNIAAAHAELERRGVAFVSAPHMIHRHEDGTEEWMAFFNDPEGRPLAIMAQAEPARGAAP